MTPPIQTTVPGVAETSQAPAEVPSFALVLLWSASQPHRMGEIAFFPSFERRYVGRGDVEVEKFAIFGRHRPGEPLAPSPTNSLLTGESISRRQLVVRATAVALEMEQLGQCVTLVNGEERRDAHLQPGDTVMLRKEALFLCVRRPKTLPLPRGTSELHAFGEPDAHGIVGESEAAWNLRARLAEAAASDEHVLLRGESGSGKELAAAVLHRASRRSAGPLVDHNASSFTTSLLESQLFGNAANYPNPGMPARPGLFARADRGTLFLDEIGDCPAEAQAQLLRALELGVYTALGESTSRQVSARVVGATLRDDSHFRPDFRARFPRSVLVPTLRERREDVPLLIRHLLLQRARKYPELARFFATGPSGKPEPRLSGRLVDYLVRQPLPRNVRELRDNLLVALDGSPGAEIRMPASGTTALPGSSDVDASPPVSRGTPVPSMPTKAELLACLDRERGNVSRVGRALGLHRNVVYRLMESYGLAKKDVAP